MELAEVVSTQVALPVFGVVLCAVLVFVFGFKSPEQPPSFEFDDDSKKRKGKKSKSPKSQTNGHVVLVTGVSEESTGTKSQTTHKSTARSSPSAKQVSPGKSTAGAKHEQKVDSPKLEMQKKNDQLKKVKKPASGASKEPKTKESTTEDDSGWTTQISRKEKKLRQKKDDKVDSPAEEKPAAIVTEEVKVEQVTMQSEITASPLMEQKNKKKNKKKGSKESPNSELSKIDSPNTALDSPAVESGKKSVEVGSKVQATLTVTSEDSSGLSETETKNHTHLEETSKQDVMEDESLAKKPPKSKKSKKEKSSAKEALELDLTADNDFVPPVIRDPVEPSPETISPNEATELLSSKTAKSPKKKKKQKADNLAKLDAKTTDGSIAVDPPVLPDTKPNLKQVDVQVASRENVHITVEKEKNVNEPLPVNVPVEKTDAKSKSSPVSETDVSPGPAFDEMGDIWIEAKPKSKKKKARRDN